ncbi:hypothetical protein YTPLAS18_10040 [Nitrospira sp.]|nr:hypothetical protein YTPLAS18_10040 [Nitrospira sp.]
MSDIFVSYANQDRPWVQRFAMALAQQKWSIWWDREIPTGQPFDEVIQRELYAAKCVIVVWSQYSVASDWVKGEADKAKKRKVLLPVCIDGTDAPLGFDRLQTQFLKDWEPGRPHVGFERLLRDIDGVLGGKTAEEGPPAVPRRNRLHPLWILIAPTVLAVAVVVVLMNWPVSTAIQLELTTERVEFRVETTASGMAPVLAALDVRSVAIEKFDTIAFQPETVQVADLSLYDLKKNELPASAWTDVPAQGSRVVLTAAANDILYHPRVTVAGPEKDDRAALHLDALGIAAGSRVAVTTRGEQSAGVILEIAVPETVLVHPQRTFTLIADHVDVDGLGEAPHLEGNELTLRIALPETHREIEVDRQGEALVVIPTFPAGSRDPFIFNEITVAQLDFSREADRPAQAERLGDRVSALTGEGEITFPGYPHLGKRSLSQKDAIGLEGVEQFTIQELRLQDNGKALHLVGRGRAKEIRTKSGGIPIEYHLTAFDKLKQSPAVMTLLAFVGWLVPTLVGVYRELAGRR